MLKCKHSLSVLWNHVVLKRDQFIICIGDNRLVFWQRYLTFFGIDSCLVLFCNACWVFLRENYCLAFYPCLCRFGVFFIAISHTFEYEWFPLWVVSLKLFECFNCETNVKTPKRLCKQFETVRRFEPFEPLKKTRLQDRSVRFNLNFTRPLFFRDHSLSL